MSPKTTLVGLFHHQLHNLLASMLIVVIFSGCKNPDSKENALTHQIDQDLQAAVTRLNIPGLTIAVTRNDSVIYARAFGVRNIETKETLTTQNIFHWASVSKTFVGTSIMQLVEQGKINLDEKLTTYLPWFKLKDPRYKLVTIRQMLNHTSGFGDVEDYEWDKPQLDEGALERFARSLENDMMEFDPGKSWQYSNTAFEVLGVVIEKVSGMPFETYIRKNIFEPLEMKLSSFIYSEIPDSLRVTGHLWRAQVIPSKVYPYNRMHAPSSTLNSNVMEMTHYAKAHLHRGSYQGKQLLSSAAYDALWTNSVNLKDEPAVGVSFFLDEHKGLKTMSHGGGDTGFRSYLLLVPEKNISVVMASNYEGTPPDKIAYIALDRVLGLTPEEIKLPIAMAYANKVKSDGIAKADEFIVKAQADSAADHQYEWNNDWVYLAYHMVNSEPEDEPIGISMFRKYAALYPDSKAFGHFGNGFARLNQMDSAKLWLKKSIAKDSSNSFSKRILKAIEDGTYPPKVKSN